MRRNMTILLVGALVAVLAIGGLATAVSAHSGTDTQTQQPNPYADAENVTDARAQYMADWMSSRMGPEGVEAFEQQTGTTVDTVAHAMAEHMVPQAGTWNQSTDGSRYGPGYDSDYQAPRGAYGPRGPGAYGPRMPGAYGPQMPCGGGYGMWGGASPGYDNGGSDGPSGYGAGGYGPGGFGSGGYGPGGYGMGGPGMHGGR